ncbi:UDP-glucuronosyltransferase 2C1-like [Liolophura sinensis]|uniref:UDP-glucuronosyltransferase 2C1-like n=1 Tax=Liolophura sinensis TaxID=3198878 RepID=UPI003158E7D2
MDHNFARAFLFLLVSSTESAKVLLITGPTFSHCSEVSAVGHALLNNGHSVFILVGSTFDHKHCFDKVRNGSARIEPIFITDSPDVTPPEKIAKVMTSSMTDGKEFSFFSYLPLVRDFSRTPCTNLFYDKQVQDRLKRERFDIAIVDTVPFTYCFFLLPRKLGIPYVGMSSVFEDFATGRPFLPSVIPSLLVNFSDSMSFFERLLNTLNYIGLNVLGRFSQDMDVIREVDQDLTRQDMIDLAAKCELYLYNYDVILSYPVPMMPNHVMVGGITAGPAQPLPPVLNDFYQRVKDGVILVTFGSNVGDLSQKTSDIMKGALRRFNTNVLWKQETEGEDGNIKTMKWLPQNDLLGNPKTKVFVSHCGNNGVFEALYHGVPLVCTVLYGDQFYNGVRVERWKAGRTLSLLTASEEDVYEAINDVLTDPVYRRNMKKASEMYHSQPMTAHQRAAFWIEHVLNYGSAHLRSKASEMSTLVYMGYDVVFFVFGSVVLTTVLSAKCIFMLLKRFCCRKDKVKTN